MKVEMQATETKSPRWLRLEPAATDTDPHVASVSIRAGNGVSAGDRVVVSLEVVREDTESS